VESDGWISMVLLFLLLSYLLLSRFLILLVYKQAKYYSPTGGVKFVLFVQILRISGQTSVV